MVERRHRRWIPFAVFFTHPSFCDSLQFELLVLTDFNLNTIMIYIFFLLVLTKPILLSTGSMSAASTVSNVTVGAVVEQFPFVSSLLRSFVVIVRTRSVVFLTWRWNFTLHFEQLDAQSQSWNKKKNIVSLNVSCNNQLDPKKNKQTLFGTNSCTRSLFNGINASRCAKTWSKFTVLLTSMLTASIAIVGTYTYMRTHTHTPLKNINVILLFLHICFCFKKKNK